jgi:hypothetical protein
MVCSELFLKTHISGEAIVYDSKPSKKKQPLLFADTASPSAGRPQGSLYNQQKRKIADACEYLRLHTAIHPGRCALVFILTSPGYTSEAQEPYFVSKWFDNMRSNYEMGEYVWVRELTKKGYPHFHVVADWWAAPWWFACDVNSRLANVDRLSLTWSRLFGSEAKTSIRLGGYWYGKRMYQLKSRTQCRYLTKYLGKTLNEAPRVCASPTPSNGFTRIVNGSFANPGRSQLAINLV